MNTAYLCLGGNIGNTQAIFKKAIEQIESGIGRCVLKSRLYTTEPWGFEAEQLFLNQVVAVTTELEPHAVLEQCLLIEAELGRTRSGNGYQPRTIDIDILFIDNQIIDLPDLKIPHPLLHLRNFVLQPMCDIAPKFVHPILKKTMAELRDECPDEGRCEVM
ncbi:MAG: 2-amino-4-hydroxy-6-hydroxymethyldihydropteridine diphosphokinase [Salinivirgaceae bacterium]|nr:2-amino-4-hydroxy-6-hydroxymethyldihydropteridine diphosphokinase [Salinivirgaceae bacterium]